LREARPSSASNLSEAHVIHLAQQGDAAAFERLYRLHRRRVYGLCLRIVNNPAEAEDLTQEAFVQLFRKIQTFRAESSFSTWLYRLTVNIVLMRLRIKSLVDCSVEEMSEASDETERPLKEFGRCDPLLGGLVDRLSLQLAIDQLPPGYKQMFILHDVEGYEHHEIAKLLGCSTGNSKSQLFKARLRLRELLREELRNREPRTRAAVRVSPVTRSSRSALKGARN
jgi:RNA polymerase sigma-70 factor (ECF subfamily)